MSGERVRAGLVLMLATALAAALTIRIRHAAKARPRAMVRMVKRMLSAGMSILPFGRRGSVPCG